MAKTTLTISSDGSPIHVAGDLIATTGGAIGITGTNAGGLDISGQLNLAGLVADQQRQLCQLQVRHGA